MPKDLVTGSIGGCCGDGDGIAHTYFVMKLMNDLLINSLINSLLLFLE